MNTNVPSFKIYLIILMIGFFILGFMACSLYVEYNTATIESSSEMIIQQVELSDEVCSELCDNYNMTYKGFDTMCRCYT